jgi:chemotaxis family two-component system response regulator Rcp1
MASNRPLEILFVEDDPGDVDLTKEALEGSKVPVKWHVVENGVEAMAFLYKKDGYADAVGPDLILLDLNMPKKDGRQVLAEIKSNEQLKMIPVIVFTTSRTEEDIRRAYKLGANCYIAKPMGLEQFDGVVRSIEEFWFTVVRLPTRVKDG